MAKNDLVLLDGILEQRSSEGLPSPRLDEVFEFLGLEELLKDYDLSHEELDAGWVDGRDDGGIDGFFTLINGHLLRDPEVFSWPKRNVSIDVWIITAKHHATFQQAPLNSLLASLPELLDLSLDKNQLRGTYSGLLIKARSLFHVAYRRLSVVRATLCFRFAYVSRGNSAIVAENVRARGHQIITLATSLFSACEAQFDFVGASELVALYRRTKKFSLELPFLEYLARSGESYVLLTRLDEFCRFVSDEHHLRRYLFDSNIRDYLGDNHVNEDIADSLCDLVAPDFWWLNNGITILATDATVVGKTIQLQDVQIVNGLQTTESIFRHFEAGGKVSASSALLVKVIVSTDTAVRDRIIRATNNQSVVEGASLHATDKIQRDIEEILERAGWFYERRKNYYRNIRKPAVRFVIPMYVAAGYIALILKHPAQAATLKARFMRDPLSYAAVFSEEAPLTIWPMIADVLKRVEDGLSQVRPSGQFERVFAGWRNLVSLLAVGHVLGRFDYSVREFVDLDSARITHELVAEIWNLIQRVKSNDGQPVDGQPVTVRSNYFVRRCCAEIGTANGVEGAEVVGRRRMPTSGRTIPKPSEDDVERVDTLLSRQPWKPGEHLRVAAQLSCKPAIVYAAIQELIARGRRLKQKDGIVYDKEGTVVAVDHERATFHGRTTGGE